MSNSNQEDLVAYRQKIAQSAQAALTGETKTSQQQQQHSTSEQHDQDRQWRNLSDPKEYEEWAAKRRDKPEDWKRYKDERLSGAISGGATGLTEEEYEQRQREYWKAKDALRGVETQSSSQQQ